MALIRHSFQRNPARWRQVPRPYCRQRRRGITPDIVVINNRIANAIEILNAVLTEAGNNIVFDFRNVFAPIHIDPVVKTTIYRIMVLSKLCATTTTITHHSTLLNRSGLREISRKKCSHLRTSILTVFFLNDTQRFFQSIRQCHRV